MYKRQLTPLVPPITYAFLFRSNLFRYVFCSFVKLLSTSIIGFPADDADKLSAKSFPVQTNKSSDLTFAAFSISRLVSYLVAPNNLSTLYPVDFKLFSKLSLIAPTPPSTLYHFFKVINQIFFYHGLHCIIY